MTVHLNLTLISRKLNDWDIEQLQLQCAWQCKHVMVISSIFHCFWTVIIIESSINQINTIDKTVRYLIFVAKSHYDVTWICVNKEACLVILLKVMVNKVKQMKYNFDASDPPRLHQIAPLSIQISKTFWREIPPDPLRARALRALARMPDRLLLQNDLLLQIFLRRLNTRWWGLSFSSIILRCNR